MYTFRIYDNDTELGPANNLQSGPVSFEFTDIVKPEDGLNKKKIREIKKSKLELVRRKPRNNFMIFRGLIKHLILEKLPHGSFIDVSKISSMVWARRTADLDKYVRYLSKQEELCQNRHCLQRQQQLKHKGTEKTCFISIGISRSDPSSKIFKHYQVSKTLSKKSLHSHVTTKKLFPGKFRIEDIYVNSI